MLSSGADCKISNKAVRASFELSWEYLAPELQRLFAHIGIFEGRSFTLEGLQAVVQSDRFDTEDDLYSLVSRSLVQLDGEDRYRQHPLLADFAVEKLAKPGPVFEKLVDYSLAYAEKNRLNLEALQPEWGNLLAVIERLPFFMEGGDGWEQILAFADALHDSWFRFGRFSDAQAAYRLAEEGAKALGSDKRLAETLLRWAEVGLEQSDYDNVWQRLETALPIYYQLEDDTGIAKVKYLQGYVLFDQGEYEKAEQLVLASKELFENKDDLLNLAKANDLLGWIYFNIDDLSSRAKRIANHAISIFDQIEPSSEKISTLRLHAIIAYQDKAIDQAKLYAEDALKLSRSMSNPPEEMASLYSLCVIYRALSKMDQSRLFALEALKLARMTGNLRYEGMIQLEISEDHLKGSKPNLARPIIEKNLDLFEKLEDRLNYGFSLRQMGDVFFQLGQSEISKKYWNEARSIALFLNSNQLHSQLDERVNLKNL